MTKIWVTKNAAAQGIFTLFVDDIKGEKGLERCYDPDAQFKCYHRRKSGLNDFEFSEDEALKTARKLIAAKIASLNKQLGKLQKMESGGIPVKDEVLT